METRMEDINFPELADLFVALSDKTRLRLLCLMAGGEVSVGYLAEALGESQPKVSRHLAFLRNAGLVSTRREGKWVFYAIDQPTNVRARKVLEITLRPLGIDHSLREYENCMIPRVAEAAEIKGENIFAEAHVADSERDELEIFLL